MCITPSAPAFLRSRANFSLPGPCARQRLQRSQCPHAVGGLVLSVAKDVGIAPHDLINLENWIKSG